MLILGGKPHHPVTAGYGWRGPGGARPPLDGVEQGRFLTAHVGPGPDAQLDPQSRQHPPGLRGGDGGAQPLDRQPIFGPDIDEGLRGADGMGGDRHPLQQPVGIAFQHGPVHEGARVTLIGITNHRLAGAALGRHQLPLAAGGVAGAAAAPQATARHLPNHRCPRQQPATLQRGVGAMGQGIVQAAGVHQSTLLQHHRSLQHKKRMGQIQTPLPCNSTQELRAAIGVVGGRQGALAAQPQTTHRLDPLGPHLCLQALAQGRCPGGPAGGGVAAAPTHGHGKVSGWPVATAPSTTSTGAWPQAPTQLAVSKATPR